MAAVAAVGAAAGGAGAAAVCAGGAGGAAVGAAGAAAGAAGAAAGAAGAAAGAAGQQVAQAARENDNEKWAAKFLRWRLPPGYGIDTTLVLQDRVVLLCVDGRVVILDISRMDEIAAWTL